MTVMTYDEFKNKMTELLQNNARDEARKLEETHAEFFEMFYQELFPNSNQTNNTDNSDDIDKIQNPILNNKKMSRKNIYLHKNVALRTGGRKAVKISKKAFKAILADIKTKNDIEDDDFYWIRDLMYEGKFQKLYNDLTKINFDFENFEIEETIKWSDKGFPYLEGIGGGDWEIPLKFYIYFDGKDLRGYIPTKGNTFNTKTKEAFSCESCDGCYIVNQICPELTKQYSKTDINKFMEDFDYNKLKIQDDWCLKDFEARIEVK